MTVKFAPKSLSQKIVTGFARLVLTIFFREIRVEGAERVPPEGPLVYVMNHPNGLVDPGLVMLLPRYPRFLARHGIWGNPVMKPFLNLAGTIPVYRRMDKGADMTKNVEAFEASYKVLAEGQVIGIFPEGISHSEPSMEPAKTGVARIVLGAAEKYGAGNTRIVPVGLMFDAKSRFRSRALVFVGEVIDPAPEMEWAKEDFRRARNALTVRIDEALREVTLNYGSWRDAELIGWAAEIFIRDSSDLPERPDLADEFGARQEFIKGYRVMKERDPERVSALAREIEVYERLLRQTGFRDEHVISSYKGERIFLYVLKTLARILVYFPLAMIGTLLNRLPYLITRWMASPHLDHPERPASKKLLAAFVAFPAFWCFWTVLAGYYLGGKAALVTAFLAPLSGYVALLFHENRRTFARESFAYLRLRTSRFFRRELQRRRQSLSEQVDEMAREYLETKSE